MPATTTLTLTEHQYQSILADFFAPAAERKRMTAEEVAALADKLNQRIDVPFFLSEDKEQKILVKIVTKLDNFLYNSLPNELYDVIRSADEGISDEEAQRLIKRLAELANEKIDIPYLPERLEFLAINLLLRLLIGAMRKNWDLGKVLARSEELLKDLEQAAELRKPDWF